MNLPLLVVVMVIVSFWSANIHRARIMGRMSMFQPLLNRAMLLLFAVLAIPCVEWALSEDRMAEQPENLLLAFYSIVFAFGSQLLFAHSLFRRHRIHRTLPKHRTQPGFPYSQD